jgi:hypothetical protein
MTAAAPLALPIVRPCFAFTRHAVDRYIERVHGGRCDVARAIHELVTASHVAELLDRPSWHGDLVWTVREPAMRWIATLEEGRAIVLTIIAGAYEGIEAERIEYDALRARRLLERIPQIGQSEPTSPIPRGDEDYRSWVGLEVRRLEVERKRLSALRDAMMTPRERTARIRESRAERAAEREAGRAHAMAEADRAIKRRNELLDALAERLAEVDPVGSAELLERVASFRCMKRGEGPA